MKNTVYPSPEIAKRVQQVFWDNGLTDKQVADAIGVDRRACLSYRNCVTSPSVKFIRYICKTYHVSADWLLDLE